MPWIFRVNPVGRVTRPPFYVTSTLPLTALPNNVRSFKNKQKSCFHTILFAYQNKRIEIYNNYDQTNTHLTRRKFGREVVTWWSFPGDNKFTYFLFYYLPFIPNWNIGLQNRCQQTLLCVFFISCYDFSSFNYYVPPLRYLWAPWLSTSLGIPI